MLTRQRRHLHGIVGHEQRPPEPGLDGLLVDLGDQLAGAVMGLEGDPEPIADRPQLGDRHLQADLGAAVLGDQLGHGGPPPGRGQVEGPAVVFDDSRAGHVDRRGGQQLLGEGHHVAVVGVGPVQLEHRELGVVAGRHPLVAEHPADLEDPLHAAHDQALEVQLGGDAQVEVGIERLVAGDEGACHRPAGDRVQHRRLDLGEARVCQAAAQRGHDLGALGEAVAALGGDPEVEVAPAEAHVGIGEAVPLVGEGMLGGRQQRPVIDAHRQLAAAGGHDDAADADPVADRQRGEGLEVGAGGGAGEELDAARVVLQRGEDELPLMAAQHQPARHRDLGVGLGPGFQIAVGGCDLGAVMRRLEAVRQPLRRPRRLSRPGRPRRLSRPGHQWFRRWTMRRPCRVRNGSTCSTLAHTGAISSASPPVATTPMSPNCSAKRCTMPSIMAAKP